MESIKFLKKIRIYAIASFLVPLIAVNSCFFIYKYFSHLSQTLSLFPNFNWNVEKVELPFNEYDLIQKDIKTYSYTNCPKNSFTTYFITSDNRSIKNSEQDSLIIKDLVKNNKIKSVVLKKEKALEISCIKNHQYTFLKNFNLLELVANTLRYTSAGFAEIKNPYFYGEVSISRTARYFPAIWIFRCLIILSAFILFFYWKNNFNFFNELKNQNSLLKFSKNFFYFGVFSCIFLALHASFLGLDIDSKLFSKIRKLIIILFIAFEILAQIFLTKNLFRFKVDLKKYINPLILRIKIIFVTVVFFITCAAFAILAFADPSTSFKHILEWNYFTFLLIFYLLSNLLWKKN